MLKTLKLYFIVIGVFYLTFVGAQFTNAYMVLQTWDIGSNATLFYVDDFTVNQFGELCVGDTIEIKLGVSSVKSKEQTITITIIDDADSGEYIIRERDLNLLPYEDKDVITRYTVKEGGSHNIYATLESDGQIVEEQKTIKVRSFKKTTNFVVTYFHFNVQFIAGDAQVEENILQNSIIPLLTFYHDNSEYKFSFEIQGYGIEIIGERYPEIMKYIKRMINRGQMELIVTHYSDQFFLAYPLADFEKSIELSDDVLDDYDLRKSNVFGTQEWQWSPYLPKLMKQHGYEIFIGRDQMFRHYTSLHENYWNYEKSNLFVTEWDNDQVYLALDRPGRIEDKDSDPSKTMIYDWAHRGDGEYVNTHGSDKDFEHNAGRQRHFEEMLEEYKEKDYKSVTLSELIYTSREKGFDKRELDCIPGSAQGSNVYVWMGEQRRTWEKDTEINTERYQTRNMLLATEVLLNKLDNAGVRVDGYQKELNDLWRDVIMAQVTDASGWAPRQIEVDYGDRLNRNVTKKCTEIYKLALKDAGLLDTSLIIDIYKNDLIDEDYIVLDGETCVPPIEFNMNISSYVANCKSYGNDLYLLSVTFDASTIAEVALKFNITNNDVLYCPLGQKEPMNLTDYRDNNTYLPLANGFIYIGNDTCVIKNCMANHILCEVDPSEIIFKEEAPTGQITYQFFIYMNGMNRGITYASKINTHPSILIDNGEMILQPILYEVN